MSLPPIYGLGEDEKADDDVCDALTGWAGTDDMLARL